MSTTTLPPLSGLRTVHDWTAPQFSRTLALQDPTSASPQRPYWERLDLYYATELFEKPVDWRLRSRADLVSATTGTGGTRSIRRWVPDFTDKHASYLATSPTVRRVVAFLAGFHSATAPQLAASTGVAYTTVQTALKKMYEAGLLHRGRFGTGTEVYPTPFIYKLNVDAPLRAWLRALDEETRLSVTAGVPVAKGGSYDRHNLLVAELALRLCEVHRRTQAVFGENLAAPDKLMPGSPVTGARADAVWVREDGLRVEFELVQASQRTQLVEKMARYGRLLGKMDWNTSGVVVVFIAANARDPRGGLGDLRAAHATALSATGMATRDAAGNRVLADELSVKRARAQIHIASWEDWFPAPWRVSDDFTALKTAYTADGTNWSRVPLAAGQPGGFPFAPADPSVWGSPRAARARVFQVPTWTSGPVRHKMAAV